MYEQENLIKQLNEILPDSFKLIFLLISGPGSGHLK
jgi:hypothetical protein